MSDDAVRANASTAERAGSTTRGLDDTRGAAAWARLLAPVVLGAIASTVVLWRTHDVVSTPSRATFAMLPLAAGAAWAVERWLGARGLVALGPSTAGWLIGALAGLGVGASRAGRSGLAAVESLIAVGLLLVLGAWVATVLRRARPLLGERLPARPSAIFFWLPFVVYASLVPWTTEHRAPDGDEPYNLLIAHSLVFDRDVDLANNYAHDDARRFLDRAIGPQLGDPQGARGQQYSRHNLLLPLALSIPYALAGRYGALLAMAALTAALAWATLRLAARYLPDRPTEVLAAWSVFAFAPPLLFYSSQIWVEVPAALLVVLGLDGIWVATAAGSSRRSVLALAAPILLLPLIKIRLTLLALSLLALYCWRTMVPAVRGFTGARAAAPSFDAQSTVGRAVAAGGAAADVRAQVRARALTALALAGALGATAAAILLHNQARFGNPLKVHNVAELDLTTHPVERYLRGFCGLLFDGAFGLFASSPIWLVAIPAVAALVARRHRLMVDAAFVGVPYLVFVAPRGEWYGGWSPPFRYGLAFLPLLGIALARAFEDRRRLAPRLLLGAVSGVTLVLALISVSAPGWTYNFANGTSRVLDHLGAQLGLDVARFFPSYVRPRLATWWAPLGVVALTALWFLPLGRRRTAARASAAGERGEVLASELSRARRRTAVATTAIGAALSLLAGATVLVAAARVPTRTVEVEDAFVGKSGGDLNPPMWTIERWRYRGAWVVPEGVTLTVPVAPGGESVTIEVDVRSVRRRHPPLELAFYAGDRRLGSHEFVEDSDWSTVRVGPFDWPGSAPLVLVARAPDEPPGAELPPEPQRNRLVIDRLRLAWR